MIKNTFLALFLASMMVACGGEKTTDEISTDLIGNPNTASDKIDEDKAPFFEFDEKVKEFGTITQGEIVSTTFKFKNVGQTDLIISSAQGSCGCTVPDWPKEPIAPGAEGKIDVTFNSAGKQGLQNKTITLVSNTVPNKYVLAIKGEVLTPTAE